MKVVFFGTPDFAVEPLKKIISGRHEVIAVVTQPDRPKGRSGKPVFSPVKEVAVSFGIPVLQYEKIRKEGVEDLKKLSADIFVTCAYGQILSQEIIDIPPHGIINIHASLLPRYRGAAPIQWSILSGDEETGVTIMRTEAGVDTGDVILQKSVKIGSDETAGELFGKLSSLGADLINEALDLIAEGKAEYKKQDESLATHVRMLRKEDGLIDWSLPAKRIYDLVRGMDPWPSAYTYYFGKTIKIWRVEIYRGEIKNAACGEIISSDRANGIVVKCSDGAIKITELQLEGAKRMTADAFLLGRSFEVGARFGGENPC